MKRIPLIIAAAALISAWPFQCRAAEYSYVDLVEKLTDLEALAVLPEPGEKTAQWSSYDRASKYENGKYLWWDANDDGPQYIREEDGKFVLAEMEGPGCIWRIWSALAEGGAVRIYLDGNPEPAVDLPFVGYFSRTNAPFVYDSLVHVTARGCNNYVPIPYQKSCKIVADPGWGRYYHFVYTTYPPGTKLPTFSRNLTADETSALEKADRVLRTRLGADPAGIREGEQTVSRTLNLGPGETAVLADLDGPRAITGIRVKPGRLGYLPDQLRGAALSIYWDGEKEPSVWSPLGDFFGTAPGVNHYKSLPLGMTPDYFYSFWYMPYARSARVELANDGSLPFEGTIQISYAPLTAPVDTMGRFHAKWHRDAFLPEEKERWIDWPMLITEGRGRYCGVMLEVWNPRGSWWGEGDEKFFIDGEEFPSTFGTGSEDYFGYAWCAPELFQNAYHNQTICENNNTGHISVNRWHVTDNIPFQTSFHGYIEKYYPNARPTLYSSITYWYLDEDGVDPYRPMPMRERVGWYAEAEVFKLPGAIEGEKLRVIEKSAGNVSTQDLGERYSGNSQLWWTSARPDDVLVLALPVEKSGSYDLMLRMTKAADYGIVQLALDGKDVGKPVDLYNVSVEPTEMKSLGTHRLEAGEHKLSVRIVGANEKAVKSYMFGLDCVRLASK